MFTLPPVPPRRRSDDEEDDAPLSDDDAVSLASAVTTTTSERARARARMRARGYEHLDLHSVDVRGAEFRALPADVRHEILSELKETRKQNSWGRLHEMPRESGDFSSYQMTRLLQRRSVQESLEAVEKEMGGRSMSLVELEELMAETGALAAAAPGKRIAADATTRYILLTGNAGAATAATATATVATVATAAGGEESQDVSKIEETLNISESKELTSDALLSVSEQENNSLVDAISLPKPMDTTNDYFEVYSDEEVMDWLPEFEYVQGTQTDSDDLVSKQLKAAHDFIFENSGLTQEQILAVIKDHSKNKPSSFDQSSTSKADNSKSLELCSPKDHAKSSFEDKAAIPSTSFSVCNAPSTSGGGMSGTPDKELDCISTKDDHNIFTSEPCVSSFPDTTTSVDTLKERNCEIQIVHDSPFKEEKGNLKEELSRVFQLPPEQSITIPDQVFGIKNVSGVPSCQLSSVSDSVLSIYPIVHSEKKETQISQSSAYNVSQNICQSSNILHISSQLKRRSRFESKESCSSEEDLVEVAESEQPAINSNIPQVVKTKVAPLEVVIQTGVTDLGMDIFADVFENGSEQPEKSLIRCTSPSLKIENSGAKLTDTSLHSVFNSDKAIVAQNPMLQDENAKRKTTNVEVDETASPLSPTSDAGDVMIMSDTGSEEVEEKIPETSNESSVHVHRDSVPNRDSVELSTQQLEDLQGSLQEEGIHLQKAQAREERLATSITDQMVQEAQELLQLFGVPYTVAPMEAEAQCAFLDRASLTDGTITDDSDIWLFGGQKVYKNFFDQKKHVLQFRDIDIVHSFKLARSQLVLLALLVGSDYTTGLTGVGPVTALEILAAFPTRSKQGPADELVEGLRRFREWYTSGTVGRWDKAKLRNKLKDLELSREFPSISVVEAYLSPKVDESMEKFSWGAPDVESIKEFARIKFGWPTSKTHEILQPIMKKLNIKITQLSMESYFQPKPNLPPGGGNLSKRIQEAIDRIGASEGSESEDDLSPSKISKTGLGNKNIDKTKNKSKLQEMRAKLSKVKRSVQSSSRLGRGRGRGSSGRGNAVSRRGQNSNTGPIPRVDISVPGTSTKDCKISEPFTHGSGAEFILQKEKDKLNLLKNKLKAIEVFRKSARGLDKTKRDRRKKRIILPDANLSESSSESTDE